MKMSHPYLSAILPGQGLSIPGPMITQGQAFFVNPYYGTGNGKKPSGAFTSLAVAKDKMTTNKNDVAYMLGAHNTSTYTTDYLSATLDWDKDLAHIIGIGAGQLFSPRSRIGFASTYNTASNLFTVSGNGNLFQGLQFYAGVAGTLPTGALQVTGSRNVFRNCHIAGIGATTNDIAGAYSLYLNGGAENLFENCVIGLDTIDRGTALNYEILVNNGAARNVFRHCIILSRIKHATNHPQVYFGSATALGDPSFTMFDHCTFINTSTNYAYTQTYIIAEAANLTAGVCIVKFGMGIGATYWSAASGHVVVNNTAKPSDYTAGIGYSA